MITRAAVAIGVDQTGGLQPLNAAAQGAIDVSNWLTSEGYDVTCLTDQGGKAVTLADASAAVEKYVNLNTVEKLVIYFAGHGYLNGLAEIWLLSGAPANSNEAIDQQESIEFARTSGISNVIFISDTCRSNPPSMIANRVRGGSLFPNLPPGFVDPEVDRFYATRPGDPAVELSTGDALNEYKGLFTEVLKEMFDRPAANDIANGVLNNAPVKVVTNRRLKECLPDRFVAAATSVGVRIRQKPQLRLECGEETFVACAQIPAGSAPQVNIRGPGPADEADDSGRILIGDTEPVSRPPTLEQTARELLNQTSRVDLRPNLRVSTRGGEGPPQAVVFVERVRKLVGEVQPQKFETKTGIKLIGSTAVKAIGIGTGATILDRPDDGQVAQQAGSLVRIHSEKDQWTSPKNPGSVLVQLAEGVGAIVATIPDYVAHVSCEAGQIVNIAYVPAENSDLWGLYVSERERIEELRAAAVTAARMGVFATEKAAAEDFARRVRRGKLLDPVLGLFASLAYAEVGLKPQIESILRYMCVDLHAVLYDIWLLAGAAENADCRRIPCCPVLNQSWSYLRPRRIQLPRALLDAKRENGLWTTFTQDSMTSLIREAERGVLQ